MRSLCVTFLVCFFHLLTVTVSQPTPINLLDAAQLTATSAPIAGIERLIDGDGNSAGYTGLTTPAFELVKDRTNWIEFTSNTIGSSLELSTSRKNFAVYTMLRLYNLKALNPTFSRTQDLFAVEESTTSDTHFKISLKADAEQTLACLTCVKLTLVVEYKLKVGGQKKSATFDTDFNQDLNDGMWHNLHVGLAFEPAGQDSTSGSSVTTITARIDCKLLESQSIGSSIIANPTSPRVVLGGKGSSRLRGYIQDFFFINADYFPIEVNLIDNYCLENSCGVDCRSSTAVLETELESVTKSNDLLNQDLVDCEAMPTLGPATVDQATAPACVPVNEKTNGGGTCTKCVCGDEQQQTCFSYRCS